MSRTGPGCKGNECFIANFIQEKEEQQAVLRGERIEACIGENRVLLAKAGCTGNCGDHSVAHVCMDSGELPIRFFNAEEFQVEFQKALQVLSNPKEYDRALEDRWFQSWLIIRKIRRQELYARFERKRKAEKKVIDSLRPPSE